MQFELNYRPSHSLATAHLEPGETLRAEASAMVSMTRNLEVHTSFRGRPGAGFMQSLKRGFLGGESFFTNTFTAVNGKGHVSLAPKLCGDMLVHELTSSHELFIQGSGYVAAPDSVELDTRWQGFKGFLSGESLFFLRALGQGPVLINALGALETIDLDGELILDTGHLVAFTTGLEYEITKASTGWIDSFLSGEGFVLRIWGRGRLYVQSRNPGEYGKTLGPKLPARQQ